MAPNLSLPTRSYLRGGMVGPGRLELPTSRLSGVRSNHLSYGPPGIRLDWIFTTDRSQPIQHLDELEIGVIAGLAGAQDCIFKLNDISQRVTKDTLRV